jgi:hypothetical protein
MNHILEQTKKAFSLFFVMGLFAHSAEASLACRQTHSNRAIRMDQAQYEVNGFEKIESISIPLDVAEHMLEKFLLVANVGELSMERNGRINVGHTITQNPERTAKANEINQFLSEYLKPLLMNLMSDLDSHLKKRITDQKYVLNLLELRWQGPDGRIYGDLIPSNSVVVGFHYDGGPVFVGLTPLGAPTECMMEPNKSWTQNQLAQAAEGEAVMYAGENRVAGGGMHRVSPMRSPKGRVFIRLTYARDYRTN